MFTGLQHGLYNRSTAMLLSIETNLDRMLRVWLVVAGLLCAARVSIGVLVTGGAGVGTVAPYFLLVLAPVVSTLLALKWFADAHLQPQPKTRLAVVGRWRSVSQAEAREHPLYGTSGIMVSLLLGMLLNIPVRAAEYLTAMPPVPSVAPQWLSTLSVAMAFDVVLFCSLYMIAFVAALRKAPLFPRLLLAIWIADVTMQLAIAKIVTQAPGLPVAVGGALHSLLEGNVTKVLISATLWLPYLLLSRRVNVTYRSRVSA